MKSETEEERGTNNPAFTFTQTNAATPHRLQPFQHLFSTCRAVWWSSSGATRVCRRCDESGSEFRDWEQHQPAGQQVVLPCALACATETNLSVSAHHGPMSSLLPVRKSFYTKWWNVPEPKVSKSLKKKNHILFSSPQTALCSPFCPPCSTLTLLLASGVIASLPAPVSCHRWFQTSVIRLT